PLFPCGCRPGLLQWPARPFRPWSISLPAQSLPKRNGRVTFFARPAKSTIMHVVLAVAGVTIRWSGDLCDLRGLVAGMTLQGAVCPGQWVAGLFIVIKAPAGPTIGVVTGGTILPEAPGMVHVLVAAAAGARGILVGLGPVALLAGDRS